MAKISLIADEERAQIAEHAFRAGFKAAHRMCQNEEGEIFLCPSAENISWLNYEPEENRDELGPEG